jgi:hypothetical protein
VVTFRDVFLTQSGHEERYELPTFADRVPAGLLRQQAAELDRVGAATTG